MKVIEIRRHSVRGAGAHLNQKGVDLARGAGNAMKRPARVITSTLERAFETAIAMGFAVDEQYGLLATMGDGVSAEIFWDSPYADFSAKMCAGTALSHFAEELEALIGRIAADIPDEGRALIITHGGIIQTIAAACLPGEDLSKLGGPPSYCEGLELYFEEGKCAGYKAIRM